MTKVFDFEVTGADGSTRSLNDYAGKMVLIVNVASKCGLTPQYEGLEALYRKYRDRGFEILGFPSNQFMGQEPGDNEEIQNFCKTTYDVTFPVLAKIDVNGEHADPLFGHLRTVAPGDWGPNHGDFYERLKDVTPATEPGDIVWNFTKFLVDRDGKVIRRYEPPVSPEEIEKDLAELL